MPVKYTDEGAGIKKKAFLGHGVTVDNSRRRGKRFRARLTFNGDTILVGRYNTEDAAQAAHDQAVQHLAPFSHKKLPTNDVPDAASLHDPNVDTKMQAFIMDNNLTAVQRNQGPSNPDPPRGLTEPVDQPVRSGEPVTQGIGCSTAAGGVVSLSSSSGHVGPSRDLTEPVQPRALAVLGDGVAQGSGFSTVAGGTYGQELSIIGNSQQQQQQHPMQHCWQADKQMQCLLGLHQPFCSSSSSSCAGQSQQLLQQQQWQLQGQQQLVASQQSGDQPHVVEQLQFHMLVHLQPGSLSIGHQAVNAGPPAAVLYSGAASTGTAAAAAAAADLPVSDDDDRPASPRTVWAAFHAFWEEDDQEQQQCFSFMDCVVNSCSPLAAGTADEQLALHAAFSQETHLQWSEAEFNELLDDWM